MKKITVILINKGIITTTIEDKDGDEIMNQYYQLCSEQLDDNCFEISVKNQEGKLDNLLIPIKNILYVSCTNDYLSL